MMETKKIPEGSSNRLCYTVCKTNLGSIGIMWRRKKRRTKIVEIILPPCNASSIRKRYPEIRHGGNREIEKISKIINVYIKGRDVKFNLKILDLNRLTSFQKRVLSLTAKIPFGRLTTYGVIAKKLGLPEGVRAVGQALARNSFPILIPCHRVIKSDGSLGGFGGGLKLKKKLLKLEGIILVLPLTAFFLCYLL